MFITHVDNCIRHDRLLTGQARLAEQRGHGYEQQGVSQAKDLRAPMEGATSFFFLISHAHMYG